MSDDTSETEALWKRADASVAAAEAILDAGFPDFAASRAYYAAFYAASALLCAEGRTFGRHSAVVAAVHRDYVRTGRLPEAEGKTLSTLFDLRAIGDYGVGAHVSPPEAREAIEGARRFIAAARALARHVSAQIPGAAEEKAT